MHLHHLNSVLLIASAKGERVSASVDEQIQWIVAAACSHVQRQIMNTLVVTSLAMST